MAKYIFIIGGVVSGLGKGITGASIGHILKEAGLKVFMQKFDPYINVDPGTMNPQEHGEVFVTADGSETDLDLGHYERFIDVNLNRYSSVTAGKVYLEVINNERKGLYNGKTVQVVPHITDNIKEKIYVAAEKTGADIIINEIGGTVGDIESLPFIEAIRQIRRDNKGHVLVVHVALVPFLNVSKEFKSKPVQHSVKELLSLGIQPDIIIARSEEKLPDSLLEKISLFCNVGINNVISAYDVDSIYKVPEMLFQQKIHHVIANVLNLKLKNTQLKKMQGFLEKIEVAKKKNITIHLVGKYLEVQDAYLSVLESLRIAGYSLGVEIKIEWIDASILTEKNYRDYLQGSIGIIVPGGFGERGIAGKILAATYARVNNIPYFGICLGMQTALIEFAQNVCHLQDANSQEFDRDSKNLVLHLVKGKNFDDDLGGTLRLGNYDIHLKEENTLALKLYGKRKIQERHRHRYEVNNAYLELFRRNGIIVSGIYEKENLVEIIELKGHRFFLGVQYHPEFTSRPNRPNPLFVGFLEAILKQ